MKLVEIAGHLIDPGKVSYVGPLDSWLEDTKHRYFTVVVDGAMIDCTFDSPAIALAARQSLIATIESEDYLLDATCCVSWPKHGGNGAMGASDALVGVEA